MSKAITATISISTDTRVRGRYFVDVRDVTAGRNRQMTTRVLDDPTGFLAELADVAAAADVAMTVIDETGGELADSAAVAESAAAFAAAPVTDDLDSKKFPELMQIAKLHNVPGRGTARRQQLIDGIRAARGDADAAFRRALSAPGHVVTEQPVTAPAVLPGRAAAALVWSGRRELSGRYAIEAVTHGKSTRYRGIAVNDPAIRTSLFPRLRDAQAAIGQHHENLARAHNDAAAMDAARAAGDPQWDRLDAQFIEAVTEDGRRSRAAAPAARPLSGLGTLRAAYAQTHPAVR